MLIQGSKNKARRPIGNSNPPQLDPPDDNATVSQMPVTMTYDALSIVSQNEPMPANDIDENNRAWFIAGIETLRCVTWNDIREATGSDKDFHMLEALVTEGIPQLKADMPQTFTNIAKISVKRWRTVV